MFTPKGLSVRSRILRISSRITSSSPDDVSMIPMAPAFDTALASCERAIQPIGAWTIGMSTPRRSVTRFEKLEEVGTTPSCRSEEHTSELQSLMRSSYTVFCLKKNNKTTHIKHH